MKKTFFYVVTPLIICLFIYLFYRTEHTVVNELFMFLFGKEFYVLLKSTINQQLKLPSILIYSLPEGLWVFAATIVSKEIIIPLKRIKFNLVLLPILIAIFLEITQLAKISNGTFDFVDLSFAIIFWLIGYFLGTSSSTTKIHLWPLNFEGRLCISTYMILFLAHVG